MKRKTTNVLPVSNTGAQIPNPGVKVCVDWVGVTWPEGLDIALMTTAWFLDCSVDTFVPMERGYMYHARGFTGPGGAKVLYEPVKREGHDAHVEMPGDACDLVGAEWMRQYLTIAVARGANFSRLDLAMDDYRKVQSVQQVFTRLCSHEAVGHVKRVTLEDGAKVRNG